jgi:hypothetical protein
VSRGKYLSLRAAREKKQLDRFVKEHPSEGDANKLDSILGAMAKKPDLNDQTSQSDSSED